MLKPNRIQIFLMLLILVFFLNFQTSVVIGSCENPIISTVPGQVDYSATGGLAWSPDNPNEVARNNCVELNVVGGNWSQYKWSVTGAGFSLAQLDTTEPNNTLCADSMACGPATISVRGTNTNEHLLSEQIDDDVYVYEGGQWQLVSDEGTAEGQYGQRTEDGIRIEEWWCTSCSVDDCAVIYESIDPAIGEIGCLEDCGDFGCVGVIRTARYFKTRAQARAAALDLIATTDYSGHSFSWGCFYRDTPWLNWDLSSIPCIVIGSYKDCIPHVFLTDSDGEVCENTLDGELAPANIAVNGNCPDSTEYCATNGKRISEWICD